MRRCASAVLPLMLAPLLLAGCATNAIRLEAAGTVQGRSREAVTATASYFDAIEQRRREAAAALVASDPSCLPATPLRIQVPVSPSVPPAPLCLSGEAPSPGYTAFEIDIGSSPRAVLEPRIALIAAISDYADALAAILDAPKTDVSAEITAFADQADRIARFSNFVAGTDLPNVNAAVASEQGQSLVALIAFADALAREARQTRDVRALVVERGAVVDRALASLSAQVTTWGRGRRATPTIFMATPCSGRTSATGRACRPTSASSLPAGFSPLARPPRMDRLAPRKSRTQSTSPPRRRQACATRSPAD
ncbi:hypothetical protein QP166_04550 [Sphingomonas sp. LR60]|uniref:hypothetical protein n=1 Tax=Sphingomonas sp. LR60 TaxID=3050233 RepID=UPI002FE02141